MKDQQDRLDNVKIVQERFGVFDVSLFGFVEMMLFTHVVVPVHALSEEFLCAVVVFCNGTKEGLGSLQIRLQSTFIPARRNSSESRRSRET